MSNFHEKSKEPFCIYVRYCTNKEVGTRPPSYVLYQDEADEAKGLVAKVRHSCIGLSNRMQTCWELSTFICVFSWLYSSLIVELSVSSFLQLTF